MNGYDLALQVTDEAFGKGTYAEMHKNNLNPEIQAAITRARKEADGAIQDDPPRQRGEGTAGRA